jgi:predicted phage baseplate assembly protein
VLLRTDSEIEGLGVDPDHPPLRWEAFTGSGWTGCEVAQDGTGGLNRPGDILLHLPPGQVPSLINGIRAAWVRAVVTQTAQDYPAYSRSPVLSRLSAACVGGTVAAIHADRMGGDVLGEADGSAGQRFPLARKPVLETGDVPVLEVSSSEGWQEWSCVPDFAGSGRDDPHFRLDRAAGVVEFGPAVRLTDGSMRSHGRVPPEGATVRLREYWTGGGSAGNVRAGALCVLRTPIPFVKSAGNRRPAGGGRDGETVDEAKLRAGRALRTGDRAVTAEDYEVIAGEAAGAAVRVHCVPPATPADPVRVLVLPDVVGYGPGRLPFAALTPGKDLLGRISAALDRRRMVGMRVVVEPPRYRGITVAVRLRARRDRDCERLAEDALAALYRWLHPRDGGPGGFGWPFGRPVTLGDVHAALAGLPDLDYVEDARLYPADPVTGARAEAAQHVEVAADELPFSFDHQVQVRP